MSNPWCSNFDRVHTLEKLLSKNNYQIVQQNGQRIYSPIATFGTLPPPKGTEIFLGNLPQDLYEDELVPLFSRSGSIYNLRLMVDFFGRNRGFAFISYFCAENAHAAVVAFDKYKIRKKTKITVSMSVDNRRLFIGNIPKYMKLGEVQSCLEKFVEGIVQVILYSDPCNEKINRGFVFVEFESHRLAAIARRQFAPGSLVMRDHAILADWADPLPIVNPEIMKQITKLYLSNIPPYINSEHLKSIVFNFVPAKHVLKVHKLSTFAFVHFDQRRAAEEAFKKLIGFRIGLNVIGVEWARPIEFSKNYREGQPPQNLCRSVPPSLRRLIQEEIEKRKPQRTQSHSSVTDKIEWVSGSTCGIATDSEALNLSKFM